MAGNTLVTNVTELIPEITEAADFIFQDRALGRQLVSVKDISGQPGVTAEFPIFTEVSGSSGVAETGVPTSHQMDVSMATHTVARRSVYVRLGDLAVAGATGDLVGGVGRAMGLAAVKMVDSRIFGVLTGTTNWGTGTGATNGTLTVTHVLDGLLLLEKQEITDIPSCVLHPHQFGKGPRAALSPIANDDAGSVSAIQELSKFAQFKGTQYGVNWFVTNRIGSGTVASTGNVYNGLLFVRSGIGYGVKTVVQGIELKREADAALTGLVMNWFDTATPIHLEGSAYKGVVKLYSTSS